MSDRSTERILAAVSHLSFFFLPFILPLVVLLVSRSPFVRHHAKQALLFHIGGWVAGGIAWVLMFVLVGFILLPIIGIVSLVCTILATVAAVDDRYYRYPFTGRFAD